jgi:hypothetical protein
LFRSAKYAASADAQLSFNLTRAVTLAATGQVIMIFSTPPRSARDWSIREHAMAALFAASAIFTERAGQLAFECEKLNVQGADEKQRSTIIVCEQVHPLDV